MNQALEKYLSGTSHDIPSNADVIRELEDEVAGENGDDVAEDKAAG
ncbi:MAG: hypothetical protein AAB898_00560 [Patescibacteria group bacterium]